jgi:hypothetical protein
LLAQNCQVTAPHFSCLDGAVDPEFDEERILRISVERKAVCLPSCDDALRNLFSSVHYTSRDFSKPSAVQIAIAVRQVSEQPKMPSELLGNDLDT